MSQDVALSKMLIDSLFNTPIFEPITSSIVPEPKAELILSKPEKEQTGANKRERNEPKKAPSNKRSKALVKEEPCLTESSSSSKSSKRKNKPSSAKYESSPLCAEKNEIPSLAYCPSIEPATELEIEEQAAGKRPAKLSLEDQQLLENLPHCPILYPTPEEYADPLAYIRNQWDTIEPAGVCLIVPPYHDTMNESALRENFFYNIFENRIKSGHREELQFPTKIQDIHQIRWRSWGMVQCWHILANRFLTSRNLDPLPHPPPKLAGIATDLYLLYLCVRSEGGYHKVYESKKWAT